MPQWLKYIFGGSGIVPAALLAIILNICLPKHMEEAKKARDNTSKKKLKRRKNG